ncbi:MAG: hypothetical protein SH868_02390 [Bythopirellula sp.]|nr:hypothetical protein [Bythopirellula sp.]
MFCSPPGAFAANIGLPVPIGTISAAALSEVSGIVDSRANSNVFWVHNDSGDSARFYAIDYQGALQGTFPLAAATAVDWEDIAIGAKPGGGNYLYLGDIGDNNAARPFVTVYRTAEPLSTASATIPTTDYTAAKLLYPSGARNAESLFVDPLTNDLFIITKTSTPQIYSAPASAFDQPQTTLTSHGVLGAPLSTATAADISPDGRHILVRSKTAARLFERGIGQSVADALHGVGVPFTLGVESQGEAIGWAADGTGFYTCSEFDDNPTAPIHYYSFESFEPGDFDEDGDVDGADLLKWQRGESPTPMSATDLAAWQNSYGTPSLVAATVVVPEPATWIGLSLAMFATICRHDTLKATRAGDATGNRSVIGQYYGGRQKS